MAPSDEAEMVADSFRYLLFTKWVNFAFLALSLYEYLITMSDELRLLWKHGSKWSVSGWFFFLSRYTMVFLSLMQALLGGLPACNRPLRVVENILETVPALLTITFSAIRVYALLKDSRIALPLSSVLLVLGLAQIANLIYVNIVLFRAAFIVDDPVLGRLCGYRYTPSLLTRIVKLAVVRWAGMIAVEAIAVLVTWYKTFALAREVASLDLPIGVSGILLRDGSILFIGLLGPHALGFLTAAYQLIYLDRKPLLPFMENIFIYILPLLLISRFTANLALVDTRGSPVTQRSILSLPRHITGVVVGNMGEMLVLDVEQDEGGDGSDFDLSPNDVDRTGYA